MLDKYIWSHLQQAIFADVASDRSGHLVVEALAGSSKSTSLIECLNHVPSNESWILLAFNKKIADELKQKVTFDNRKRVICTTHSLGLRVLGQKFKKITVNQDKMADILADMLGDGKAVKEFKFQLIKVIELAKSTLAETAEEIEAVIDTYDLDISASSSLSEVTTLTLQAMEKAKAQPKVVDYTDMIWLPNVLNLRLPRYDRIMTDESQDFCKAQIHLVLRSAHIDPKTNKIVSRSKKKPSRITAFLDRNQCLYSWRGADTGIADYFIDTLQAKTLPLSISYRCPISVVKMAQKYVPAFEAAPMAKEGSVTWITTQQMKLQAKPGCFILSRTNAPLISYALNFLKQRIPCNIQGRDLGQNLLAMIRTSKASNIKDFLAYLDRWAKIEIQKLVEKGKDVAHINDKVACFEALSEGCDKLTELQATIEKLFDDTDDKSKIILSTVHRCKGLEREVVYILTHTFIFGNAILEKNCAYVATTRSQNFLYLVSITGKPDLTF